MRNSDMAVAAANVLIGVEGKDWWEPLSADEKLAVLKLCVSALEIQIEVGVKLKCLELAFSNFKQTREVTT